MFPALRLGGGAGGSIYATAGLLTGSGVFTANGGQGGSHGGGGGGGRIAVYYGNAAGFSGFASSTANGGTGGQAGGKGTVAFVDTSVPGARFYTYQNFVFPEDSTIAYQAMTTDNSATLTIGGGSIITISGILSIVGNSTLFLQGKNNTSQVSGQWIGEGVTINAGDVTIDTGSKISTDGQGYTGVVNAKGNGPGGGAGHISGGAGGGYGGRGGNFSTAAGGIAYGSGLEPLDLGSAGGSDTDGSCPVPGAAGGGAIRLAVSGTLTLNGAITAQGQNVSCAETGGGSGGSIFLKYQHNHGFGQSERQRRTGRITRWRWRWQNSRILLGKKRPSIRSHHSGGRCHRGRSRDNLYK